MLAIHSVKRKRFRIVNESAWRNIFSEKALLVKKGSHKKARMWRKTYIRLRISQSHTRWLRGRDKWGWTGVTLYVLSERLPLNRGSACALYGTHFHSFIKFEACVTHKRGISQWLVDNCMRNIRRQRRNTKIDNTSISTAYRKGHTVRSIEKKTES